MNTNKDKAKVPYHETKWRTINMRPAIKDLLTEIAKATGNGYTPVPMCQALEDLVIAKHRELFKK